MNESANELTLSVSRVINASREKTFDAWLDAKTLASFILPKPGMPNPEVTANPEVGGEFEIIMDVGERKIPHYGAYLQIDRPNKLQFTWNSPFSAEDSVVTIDFRGLGADQMEVTLVHRKFPSEENRDDHNIGWGNILEALETNLGIG